MPKYPVKPMTVNTFNPIRRAICPQVKDAAKVAKAGNAAAKLAKKYPASNS
jgi:hypothetical protein